MFKLLLIIFFLASCSSSQNESVVKSDKSRYDFTDVSGTFYLDRETFLNPENQVITKEVIFPQGSTHKEFLERVIMISDQGFLAGKQPLLRPNISQYTVIFDGKKYFSELKLDTKRKALVHRMVSPEEQWSGMNEFKLPKSTGVFCFYSQVAECVAKTGFLKMALKEKTGIINFHIIWNGYPYLQEQYANIPNEVMSPATMTFEGLDKEGNLRLTMEVAGHTMFYFTDKDGKLLKRFWINQGLSQTLSSIQEL